jgi:hypothetical protein
MGESKFNKLVEAQEAHYKAFFQVPEETVEPQEEALTTPETTDENEKETT